MSEMIVATIGDYFAVKTTKDPHSHLKSAVDKAKPRYITDNPNQDEQGIWYWVFYGEYLNDEELKQKAKKFRKDIRYTKIIRR